MNHYAEDQRTRALKMPFSAGRPETLCGAGTMLKNTTNVRGWLPLLLDDLNIDRLLDVPCGDFNWMSQTDLSHVHYIGCDYDPIHCDVAAKRASSEGYAPRSKTIVELDLLRDPLPPADLILCRDFLQHIPFASIAKVIDAFRSSECEWLLTTSHLVSSNDDIESAGQFRPLNLMLAPFLFPCPQKYIEDETGCGRILALFAKRDLC